MTSKKRLLDGGRMENTDPICCIAITSDNPHFISNLNELLSQFAFWPCMDVKQIGKNTVMLSSIEEPICELSAKWKGLKARKRQEPLTKKNIALALHNEGGYEVSKVYPEYPE